MTAATFAAMPQRLKMAARGVAYATKENNINRARYCWQQAAIIAKIEEHKQLKSALGIK